MDENRYGGEDYYNHTIFPETREEARAYIDHSWCSEGVLAECEALVDFRVESRRVLSAWSADRQGIDKGVPVVMKHCYNIPSGPDTLVALREMVDGNVEFHQKIASAYHHLEQAAALVHVEPTLFLGLPRSIRNKTKDECFNSRDEGRSGKWAPLFQLEGESEQEYGWRKLLYEHAHGIRTHAVGPLSGLVEKSDRRAGAGGRAASPSTKKMFVRMLWDAWPQLMRENSGNWRPKITASNILKYCGHTEVTANDFHRYADELNAKARNAERRKHELP